MDRNPFECGNGELMRIAVGYYLKNGKRIGQVRHQFSATTLEEHPCGEQEFYDFLGFKIEWKLGQQCTFDHESDPWSVTFACWSTMAFTQYCRVIALPVFRHFLGIETPTRMDWVIMGNLIGFNGHGDGMELFFAGEPEKKPKPNVVNDYLNTQARLTGTKPAVAPKREGAVKRVWEIASSMPNAGRAEVLRACVAAGINENTAKTQYQRWRSAK